MLPYDSAIPVLHIQPKEMKHTFIQKLVLVFIANFKIEKKLKAT